jgi:aspartyl-tRNA(Asn)/glutamyl-tRNA(Gln) amidotransferase subunit A
VNHSDLRAETPPSVFELAFQVRNLQVSAVEVVRRVLDRIERMDAELRCFREVYAERSLASAGAVDARLRAGESPGPLAGVPIAVKDVLAIDFGVTACGSRMLEHYRSPFTATAVQRLINAGAIIIGKTNCDEFAMGSSTEHCAFGSTRNPWDLSRVPGGSSGGSAAAVAAGLCAASLGTDTGGSIRQPAALCGVVGVKPSYGRVSRHGLVAFGSSLDQAGPFTMSVRDAALLLQLMAGRDDLDSTCSDSPVPDYSATLDHPIDDLRIGVPRQYLSEHNEPAVNEAIRAALAVYRDLGATLVDVDLPLTDYGVATYYVIAPAEASSNLARFDGVRFGRRSPQRPGDDLMDLYARSRAEGFGREVQRRIMLGTYVLSAGYYDAYYLRALRVRRLIKREFDEAFQRCHALVGPTSPVAAFEVGARGDPMSMYLCDVYTVNANIAGLCGISIPAGFTGGPPAPLPIGMQILCRPFDEATMFRVAHMFQSATNFHTRRPASPSSTGTRGSRGRG